MKLHTPEIPSSQCSHVWGYTNNPLRLITSQEQFKSVPDLENIIPFNYCPYCGVKLPKVSV